MLQEECTCPACSELERIVANGNCETLLLHWQNCIYEENKEDAIKYVRRLGKGRISYEDAKDKVRNIMLGEPSKFWCAFVCKVEDCAAGDGIRRSIFSRLKNDVIIDSNNIFSVRLEGIEDQKGGSYVADSTQPHVEDKIIRDKEWQSFQDDFDQAIFLISQELSPKLAVFLDMWYFQGMEVWQIVEKLDVPEANVRLWKHRTIKKLSAHSLMMSLREKYDSRMP